MESLREKIQKINNDNDLSATQKSQKIFELMNPNQKNSEKEDKIIDFDYDKEGCVHYKRGCLLKAECCGSFVPCRLCHDEKYNHKMNRFETKIMKCKICDFEQSVDKICKNCNSIMGEYYCNICKLWSSDKEKDIYHCDDCGICRVGKRDSFFHCNTCQSCISSELKNNHKCLEKSLHVNCSICNEFLFTSVKNVSILKCGHYIHAECLENYIKQDNYQCPVCKKSIIDMKNYWNMIDLFLKDQSI